MKNKDNHIKQVNFINQFYYYYYYYCYQRYKKRQYMLGKVTRNENVIKMQKSVYQNNNKKKSPIVTR